MKCPNCKNFSSRFLFKSKNTHGAFVLSEEKFVIQQCTSCKTVFPRIKARNGFYEKYYPKNYYSIGKIRIGIFIKALRFLCLSFIKTKIHSRLKGGSVLDFGSGQGDFLASLPDTFEKDALDSNKKALAYIKRNFPKIDTYQKLNQIGKTKKFDLITLWHSLEHINQGRDWLVKLSSKLKKDGYLFLSTPNTNSLGFRISQSSWFHLDCPRHLNLYDPEVLKDIGEQNGLKLASIKTNLFEYPLDLFWSLRHRFKTPFGAINLLLIPLFLVTSFFLKIYSFFDPSRAETFLMIFKKTSLIETEKKRPFYLKKFFLINFFFLITAIIGFFCILPSKLDYGDHASLRLVYEKNLIEYLKQRPEKKVNFVDFFKDQYRSFHDGKYQRGDSVEVYAIDNQVKLGWYLHPSYYSVYILPRLGELSLYVLFGSFVSLEATWLIFAFLIFVATYVFAYKLGKVLLSSLFGIILAVFSVSNVYFNQLVRGMLTPFTTLYPLLFYASFFFLFSSHLKKKRHRLWTVLGFALSLSACFLNGYPNTNVVLLGLLAITFVALIIYLLFSRKTKFTNLAWYFYILIPIVSLSVIFYLSAIWSYLLGENIFYGSYIILNDRIWGLILKGLFVYNPYKVDFWQTPKIVLNSFKVVSVSSRAHVGPHEPGFLHDLSFLNPLESVFLLFGLVAIFVKRNIKKLVGPFTIILFLFFITRLLQNSANYLIIGRYSYDYYFVLIFIAALGFYTLTGSRFFQKRKITGFLVYIVLIVSLAVNIFSFNSKFVWEYEEGLKQTSGLSQVRKFYFEKVLTGKNLFLYDYNRANGYEYHIDQISLLQGNVHWDTLDQFIYKNKIKSKADFRNYLEKNLFDNIYIVVPVGLSNHGAAISFETLYNFHRSTKKFLPFFSIYEPDQVITNHKGIPKFWIFKPQVDEMYDYFVLDQTKTSYQLGDPEPSRLEFIEFPGWVKKIKLIFDGQQEFELDFSRFSYDRFHLNFDGKGTIDVYNNFNYLVQDKNLEENDLFKIFLANFDQREVFFLEPQKTESTIVFNYDFGFPLEKVYLNIPFLFYNDQFFNNRFTAYYQANSTNGWRKIDEKKSNGNLKYLDYDHYYQIDRLPSFFPNNHFNFLEAVDLKQDSHFKVKYEMRSVFARSVMPVSVFYNMPEETNNILRFEVNTSHLAEISQIEFKNLVLEMEYNEDKKEHTFDVFSFQLKK